jgi:hypothetical protein
MRLRAGDVSTQREARVMALLLGAQQRREADLAQVHLGRIERALHARCLAPGRDELVLALVRIDGIEALGLIRQIGAELCLGRDEGFVFELYACL